MLHAIETTVGGTLAKTTNPGVAEALEALRRAIAQGGAPLTDEQQAALRVLSRAAEDPEHSYETPFRVTWEADDHPLSQLAIREGVDDPPEKAAAYVATMELRLLGEVVADYAYSFGTHLGDVKRYLEVRCEELGGLRQAIRLLGTWTPPYHTSETFQMALAMDLPQSLYANGPGRRGSGRACDSLLSAGASRWGHLLRLFGNGKWRRFLSARPSWIGDVPPGMHLGMIVPDEWGAPLPTATLKQWLRARHERARALIQEGRVLTGGRWTTEGTNEHTLLDLANGTVALRDLNAEKALLSDYGLWPNMTREELAWAVGEDVLS